MKLTTLLSALTLLVLAHNSFAQDPEYKEADNLSYCSEQAEISGIEDAQELSAYIRECVESMGGITLEENEFENAQNPTID